MQREGITMEFTTVDDIKALFRRIKIKDDTGNESTNTVVTTEEVTSFIEETELIVKTHISRCYSIESIGTESKKILGVVTKYMVAHTIQGILTTASASKQKDQQIVDNKKKKKAMELLQNICPDGYCDCKKMPVVQLPDTPLAPNAPDTNQNVFSSNNNTPQFTKGGPNW